MAATREKASLVAQITITKATTIGGYLRLRWLWGFLFPGTCVYLVFFVFFNIFFYILVR
jgi:hypothetical protein